AGRPVLLRVAEADVLLSAVLADDGGVDDEIRGVRIVGDDRFLNLLGADDQVGDHAARGGPAEDALGLFPLPVEVELDGALVARRGTARELARRRIILRFRGSWGGGLLRLARYVGSGHGRRAWLRGACAQAKHERRGQQS